MYRILIQKILLAVFAVFVMMSCNREPFSEEDGYGYLCISVNKDSSEDVIVKAIEPVEDPYIVELYNSSGVLVAKIDDHRELEANPLKLKMGTYTLKARNRELTNGSFTEFFSSEKQIRIKPEETLVYDITCVRADCRLSVSFPDDFSNTFKVYQVAVSNGEGEEMVLSNKPDPENPNHASLNDIVSMKVTGTMTWSLYMKNNDSADDNDKGGIYTYTRTYRELVPGVRYHLQFSIAEPEDIDGVFALRVVVDGEMIEESHDIKIDFDQKNQPTYELVGLELPQQSGAYTTVIFEDKNPKSIKFNTPAGLKHLYISHFDDDLTEFGVPMRTDLNTANQSGKDQISLLGIEHHIGDQESSLDITRFVGSLPAGIYDWSITAIDKKGRYARCDFPIEIVLDVDAEVANAAPWAQFAFVEARYFNRDIPEGLTFQYKEYGKEQWQTVESYKVDINTQTMRFSALIDGLYPETKYVVRAISANDLANGKESKELEFTTEIAETLHNMSFDEWTNDNKFPNASGFKVWDSANSSGAATTTFPETSDVKSGKAAKLTTTTAFGMLAAGNIFTGEFAGLAGLGAKLNWGYTFESRPIALKGYYKYSPQTITEYVDDKYSYVKNTTDQFQILIALTDWSAPFLVNTSTQTFVNFDTNPGVIAYGVRNSDVKNSDYVPFTIPLEYRAMDRIPKYIIIAAAASRYGDYFTGAVGSTLLVDEFELIYDPADLSDEEFEKVFANIE